MARQSLEYCRLQDPHPSRPGAVSTENYAWRMDGPRLYLDTADLVTIGDGKVDASVVNDLVETAPTTATTPTTSAASGDDREVKRLQVAAAIARADLERLQAVAMRDEALRLQREADRARRVEQIVEAAVESVYPFEAQLVEQLLRQRLIGTTDLGDGFGLRALIAGALGDARRQLMQQRADADRVAAERRDVAERAAAEARQRAAVSRAADDARTAEQQALTQAAALGSLPGGSSRPKRERSTRARPFGTSSTQRAQHARPSGASRLTDYDTPRTMFSGASRIPKSCERSSDTAHRR